MDRRKFMAASAAAGAGAVVSASASDSTERCFYELIKIEVLNNAQKGGLEKYWEEAAIPALNRLGITPVGVLKPKYGTHGLDYYILIPHPTIDSFLTSWGKLANDKQYLEKGKAFLQSRMDTPSYYRFSTSLMHAFTHLPKLEMPESLKGKAGRIFEIRLYESHSREKALLKVEMFNEGGEIQVFRETGLNPVMFGETLAGEKMPNLTYMLAFENMEDRDASWKRFVDSDGWNKLKNLPRYKETVSAVTDVILSPASCSQI
jgi:NIPSNAP